MNEFMNLINNKENSEKHRKVRIHKNIKRRNIISIKFILFIIILILFILIVLLSIIISKNIKLKEKDNEKKQEKEKEKKKEKEEYKKNIIHLSVNIDDKYIYPCIVYLTSLLDNRAISTIYIIHVLTNNRLSNEFIKKIDKIIS